MGALDSQNRRKFLIAGKLTLQRKFGYFFHCLFWKRGNFCESNVISLESPCIDLFPTLSHSLQCNRLILGEETTPGNDPLNMGGAQTLSVLKIPLL